MNILIVYGTVEGQTRKIADFLKTEAVMLGHKVTLCDATMNPANPVAYDAVLIASSVHLGKYQTAIQHYIHKNKKALNKLHTAFISVSLTAAGDDEELWKDLRKTTSDFIIDTGWKPGAVEYVAGALLYTEYDFFKKFIVRAVAKKTGHTEAMHGDTEYTDWNKLRLSLKKFIDTWSSQPVIVQADVSDQEAVG